MAIYQGDNPVAQGTPGKTAYQSAIEGGYQGTEAEFYTMLALAGTAPVEIVRW